MPHCQSCPLLPTSYHSVSSFLLSLVFYLKRVLAVEGPDTLFMRKLGLGEVGWLERSYHQVCDRAGVVAYGWFNSQVLSDIILTLEHYIHPLVVEVPPGVCIGVILWASALPPYCAGPTEGTLLLILGVYWCIMDKTGRVHEAWFSFHLANMMHSLIHVIIQSVFTKYLHCSRHYAKHWEYNDEQGRLYTAPALL